MALLSINPVQQKEKGPSAIEKVALAFKIAQDAMGTALAVPKFIQERNLAKGEQNIKKEQLEQEKIKTKVLVGKSYRPPLGAETPDITIDGTPLVLRETEKMSEVDSLAYKDALQDYQAAQPGERDATEWTFGPAKVWLKPKPGSQNIDRRIKQESDLRKEFKSDDRVKDFSIQSEAAKRLDVGVKDDSLVGDIAIIYSYIKLLDPSSAVKEGEVSLAQSANPAVNQAIGLYNAMITGKSRLKNRKDYVRVTKGLVGVAKKRFDAVKKFYTNIANRKGFDPVDVIVPIGDIGEDSAKDLSDEELMDEYNRGLTE